MKKRKKEKKREKTKGETTEIFEIEKNGKTEIKKLPVKERGGKEKISKKQVSSENQLLRNLLIGIAIFILGILLIWWAIGSMTKFTYDGLEFKMVKEGKLLFYSTSFPLFNNGKKVADYNVYLRGDPRKSDDIEVNVRNFQWREVVVINSTESFSCDGDGIIAIKNMEQILDAEGIKIVQDPNAACDEDERYMFIRLEQADNNSIEQIDRACYQLNIKDCDILPVTEKFILETLKEIIKRAKWI